MIFTNNIASAAATANILRHTKSNDGSVDAWIGEDGADVVIKDQLVLKISKNGIFGEVKVSLPQHQVSACVKHLYTQIFATLDEYPEYRLLRIWNYLPGILEENQLGSYKNVYEAFNSGRFQAFEEFYGEQFQSQMMPSASAVGTSDAHFTVEFLAVKGEITFLENKDQIAARAYSEKYGKYPPLFSRGAIFKNLKQTMFISSGTASVLGEDSVHADLFDQVNQSLLNLRVLGSQFNLKRYKIEYGFALEDAVLLRTYYKNEEDEAMLGKYLKKVVSPDCQLSFMKADICRSELLVEIEGVFVKKGEFEQAGNVKYKKNAHELIRTESFELHIAEHCNLRCRDCCNISPFNPQKFMMVEEIDEICQFLKKHIKPDLFKIAGGEPTLHPQIDEIISVIKRHQIAAQVRVVSNGLLVHRMSEFFWQEIDQLTISNYVSAPVKLKTLDLIKSKAKQYGFVTNIKYVEQFNEIFVKDAFTDPAQIKEIYDDCWMRHRCHIIRNGYFYKCTRAAYMNDSLSIQNKETEAIGGNYSAVDGISISHPDFKALALDYLNQKKPLQSCQYCLGVSGGLRENVQLSKKEVAELMESKYKH